MLRSIRQWWQRQRAKRSVAAQPVLTFDALLARAALVEKRTPKSGAALVRPQYLPKNPGRDARNIALAIGGGACLYGTIALTTLAIQETIPWGLLILIIPLLALSWKCVMALIASLRSSTNDVDVDAAAAVRTLLWPITESLVILFGWALAYTRYGIERVEAYVRARLSHRGQLRSASSVAASDDRTRAFSRLPDVLQEMINTEQEALIGPNSELVRLRERIKTVITDARNIRAHFARRMDRRDPPTHLVAAHDRAHAVVETLEQHERELDAHQTRIRNFYHDCHARAHALREDVGDLTLFARLQHVERGSEEIADAITDVIARSSVAILMSAYRLRDLLADTTLETGAVTASAVLDSPDGMLDFGAFEATIARFVERAQHALPEEPDALPIGERTAEAHIT